MLHKMSLFRWEGTKNTPEDNGFGGLGVQNEKRTMDVAAWVCKHVESTMDLAPCICKMQRVQWIWRPASAKCKEYTRIVVLELD